MSIKHRVRTNLDSHAVKISWSEPYLVVSTNDMSFFVFRYRAQSGTEAATLTQAYNELELHLVGGPNKQR